MTEKNELSISEALRRGREARGETLEQVQQRLGVSMTILKGIEAGDYNVVEPIYARLAVWHYAEHVGLGGDTMAARFEQEIGLPEDPVAMRADHSTPVPVASSSALLTFIERQPHSRLIGAVVLFILLLVAAAALVKQSGSQSQSYDQPDDYLSSPLSAAGDSASSTESAADAGTTAPTGSVPPAQTPGAASGSAAPATTVAPDIAETQVIEASSPPAVPSAAGTAGGAGGGEVPNADQGNVSEETAPETGSAMAAAIPAAETVPTDEIVVSNEASTSAGSTAQADPLGIDDGQSTPELPSQDQATSNQAEPDQAEPDQATSDQAIALDSVTAPVAAVGASVDLDSTTAEDLTLASSGIAPSVTAAVGEPTGEIVLEVRALDSTWVQVQWDGVDGIEEIIPQGQIRQWSADRFFLVRAGRAHGVHFRLQGTLLGDGRLGDATKVLRFRGLADGYQLLGPELEPLGAFTPIPPPEPAAESVDTERP